MAYGSTVPLAWAAIVTALGNRAALADVKILREWPRSEVDVVSDDGTPEAIWCGRDGEQNALVTADVRILTAGQLRFDESYTFWVTIQVMHREGTMKTASERAWTLHYELLACVADDARIAIADDSTVAMFEISSYTAEETTQYLSKGGAACQIVTGLNGSARIAPT